VREIGQHTYTPGKLCELLLNDYMAEVQPKSRVAAE
jgi:hypothetical protein